MKTLRGQSLARNEGKCRIGSFTISSFIEFQIPFTYFVPDTIKTDTYVLSMTYKPGHSEHLGNGGFGLATQDEGGNWVNAIDKIVDGVTPTFVKGLWKEGYALGTYGVDASTKTAWVVINYDGSFAVANGIEPVPGHRK